MKHLKYFEYLEDRDLILKEDEYIGYKRYLGFPPLIVKILSINKYNKKDKYFVEDIKYPYRTYEIEKWEMEELSNEQLEELDVYLNSKKYNL